MSGRWAIVGAMMLLTSSQGHGNEPIPFRTSVLPILTKAGCNSGACHGAATGQGGFKLSLLGYDPEEDYDRITRELGSRRVDLNHPEESLLLKKASGTIDHEGGRRLRRGSDGYELVRRWLTQEAPYGPSALQVLELSTEPSDHRFALTSETRQLQVFAHLSDSSRQNVTPLALYNSNDEAIANVSQTGEIRSVGRGLTSIMIRYSGQVAATRVAVPFDAIASPIAHVPRVNAIDDQIQMELRRLGVSLSPLSDEAEFLRRVTLDLTGRLPEPEKAMAFFAEPPSAAKRARLIDELIGSEAFIDLWTLRFADWLLLSGKGAALKGYHHWLRQQIATHAPLDRMVQSLLTATGRLDQEAPANFQMLASDPRDFAEHVGRIFLGIQIGCARCHAHPSDRWTQDDYHRFAAFFARIRREDGEVRIADAGEVDHPKNGKPLSPKPLGGSILRFDQTEDPDPSQNRNQSQDRRQTLARWLVSTNNTLWTQALVNRVWKQLLGRGLVEPVDDLRPTNPATHPALLERLGKDFAADGFNLRSLIRQIVLSSTYQLSSRTQGNNRIDSQLYSHARVKPLSAQVFADIVAQVSGTPDHFEGYEPGTRAVQLVSASTPAPALDLLGRCLRKRSCDAPAQLGGGLAQALHLINGSTINEKLESDQVHRWMGQSDRKIVEELYLRALTRLPSSSELAEWETLLAQRKDRKEAIQDLLWTVLNSREFSVNH